MAQGYLVWDAVYYLESDPEEDGAGLYRSINGKSKLIASMPTPTGILMAPDRYSAYVIDAGQLDDPTDGRLLKIELHGSAESISPFPPRRPKADPLQQRQEAFRRLDKNKDGKVTEQEAATIWRLYRGRDVDQDGALTLDEFTTMPSTVRPTTRDTIDRFDKNGDRQLSKDEIPPLVWDQVYYKFDINGDDVLTKPEWAQRKLVVDDIFKAYDRNGDGSLTEDEINRHWLKFKAYDVNRDGRVLRKEFENKKRRHTLLVKFDKNDDDTVTREEAGAAWRLLKSYDTNQDGKVTAAELSPASR